MKISNHDIECLLQISRSAGSNAVPEFEKSRLFALELIDQHSDAPIITQRGREALAAHLIERADV